MAQYSYSDALVEKIEAFHAERVEGNKDVGDHEVNKEPLREAQRLLGKVLREPTPAPLILKLDEFYTIGQKVY